MPFGEAIRIAFASLRAAKLRAFLTVLGILIGVGASLLWFVTPRLLKKAFE